MINPIFWQEKRIGFAAVMSHHIDVGGRTPGSMVVDSTSIHQEGLRLDTGGPGKYRGGLSLVREWETLTDNVTLQVRSDCRALSALGGNRAANAGRPPTACLIPAGLRSNSCQLSSSGR